MDDVRSELFRKLKDENCFWSYDLSKMDSISDEALIEHVLLYLDIDDINKLFPLFGYKKVKRVWLDRVAPQGEMFRQFNILYAWYYFGAKRPEAYVKSIETRHMNQIISRLECIKPYTLVGGTALSLQIEKRQSEDLDFMKWQQKKNEKCEYAPPRKSVKSMQRIPFLNNLYLADMESIGTMKMEAR